MEEWRDIKDYEGLYQISNLGRVKSLERTVEHPVIGSKYINERILKTCFDSYGYLIIRLCKNGVRKTRTIHRLVAYAFIPNPDKLPCINHKNEIKTDNRVENLEYCDCTYNNNYGTRIERSIKKLSKEVICVETGTIYTSTADAGRYINKKGAQGSIARCCNGKRNTAYGYHWRYIEKG